MTSSKFKVFLTSHTMQVMEGNRLYLGNQPVSSSEGHPVRQCYFWWLSNTKPQSFSKKADLINSKGKDWKGKLSHSDCGREM